MRKLETMEAPIPHEKLDDSIYCIFIFDLRRNIYCIKELKEISKKDNFNDVIRRIEEIDARKQLIAFELLRIFISNGGNIIQNLGEKYSQYQYYYLKDKVIEKIYEKENKHNVTNQI